MMGSGSSSSSSSSSDSEDESSSFDASDGNRGKSSSNTQVTGRDGGDRSDLDLSQLFHHTSLREAASKIKDDFPETVLQQHHTHILRWLEDKTSRHEETVTLPQFCEFLMARGVGREECVEAFDQFDVDDEGCADVANMLEIFKTSNSANLRGELSYVVRTLENCSLTPGLVDVYSTDREGISHHGKRLVKYVLRNRAPSTSLPFVFLDAFNNITSMRLIVLDKYLLQKQKESALKEMIDESGGNIKIVNKCYKWIRVSTSHNLTHWLEDNDSSTYWQSNGHARSHWIRLRLKDDICLQHLSVKVAQADQSYMPQHIEILTGRSPNSLHAIHQVSVPNNVTGDVSLLQNAHVMGPYVQINIARCHSDGCDVRIHGVKTVGYRSMPTTEVTVKDASMMWYFSIMASTTTITMATNPHLKPMVLQHTRTALSHMPPLSLSASHLGRNPFPSPFVLDQTEDFLNTMARNSDGMLEMEGIKILLELALARGIVMKIVTALQHVLDSKEEEIAAVKALRSLKTVTEKLRRKYAVEFPVTVAGCDGGQKESSSGPSNVLNGNWASDPYLSEKTKVNMFFVSETTAYVTKLIIKVSKGSLGPAAGFVFVYNDEEEFQLERHQARFEMYDGLRSASIAGKPDNRVAFFTSDSDYDEIDVPLDELTMGRYILVKFLRPRDPANAERLGIVGIKFFGHVIKSTAVQTSMALISPLPFADDAVVTSAELCIRILQFIVNVTSNQELFKKAEVSLNKTIGLDMQSVSLELLTKFYHSIPTTTPQWTLVRMFSLKLLHQSYPFILGKLDSEMAKLKKKTSTKKTKDTGEGSAKEQKEEDKPAWLTQWEERSQSMFTHLCELVNRDTPDEGPESMLQDAAKDAILDGAALFFPDKEKRKKELFRLMDLLSTNVEPATNLVFQSLCHHFGSIDPSGLLNLPSNPTEENFEEAILGVFKTLQSVVFKEFEKGLSDTSELPKGQSYVCKLLSALQASLMAWCKDLLQAKTPNPDHVKLAHRVIAKYTSMLTAKSVSALTLLHSHLLKRKEVLQLLDEVLKDKAEAQDKEKVSQPPPKDSEEKLKESEKESQDVKKESELNPSEGGEDDQLQRNQDRFVGDDRTKEIEQDRTSVDAAAAVDELQKQDQQGTEKADVLVGEQQQAQTSGDCAGKQEATQEATQTEAKEATQTEAKEATQTEAKEATQTEAKEATQTEAKEATQTEAKETTQTEAKETTQTEAKERNQDRFVGDDRTKEIEQDRTSVDAAAAVDELQKQDQQGTEKADVLVGEQQQAQTSGDCAGKQEATQTEAKEATQTEAKETTQTEAKETTQNEAKETTETEAKETQTETTGAREPEEELKTALNAVGASLGHQLIDALQHSFVGMTMRQLTLMLILLSDYSLPQPVLNDVMQISLAIKRLQELMGQEFNEGPAQDTKDPENKQDKVALRKWDVESGHKYSPNEHITQIFNCPGAQVFQVDFDPRCETENRYDYLEFTDSFGVKTRYDQKVGSDKWPVSHTFKSPHRLQFLFHSDSSNEEWGYKFIVTAKGSRDIHVSWLYDLQLSLAKLQGKMCAKILTPQQDKLQTDPATARLLKKDLWTTLFRGGHEVAQLTRSYSGIHRTEPIESVINDFLVGVSVISPGAPAQFINKCQAMYHMPSVGGELVNSAVMSVFAALLWHSQELRDTIPVYAEAGSTAKPTDGIIQAFRTAEGLRPLLISIRQKQIESQEKDASKAEAEPDTDAEIGSIELCREKARFLLQFAGLTKMEKKLERRCSELYTRSKSLESRAMRDRQTSSEMNAAFQGTAEEGTVLSLYPEFKFVLDFVKNQHLTVKRVRQVLTERQGKAKVLADTFRFAYEFLKVSGKPNVFQADCVQFLKEMLFTIKMTRETHYASWIEGCGLELEGRVRGAFYQLVEGLIEAIENFDSSDQTEELQAGYACIQACVLHLLDVDWQPYDLQFLCKINAPSLLLDISKRNTSIQDKLVTVADEATELEVHKQYMAWLKEFQTSSNRFQTWFGNITRQDTLEKRRAMHSFIARYAEKLDGMSMICDGCKVTLRGAFYHCLQCEAFDFCKNCFSGSAQVKGHEDDHPMAALRYDCDQCKGFIVGTRIHCNVCDDFDLCYGCNQAQEFPSGHTALHSTEIFPMTTVTSGKQHGIQLETYSHHHAWLLFSSLALSLAEMMHSAPSQGVNTEYAQTASKLFQHCIELAAQCLPSITQTTTEGGKDEGAEDKEKSTETKEKENKVTVSGKDLVKLREKAFIDNEQERVLGLLGAMLLENTCHDSAGHRQGRTREFHFKSILPLLLKLAREPGTKDAKKHQIVAFLGQLLLHIQPKDADEAVRQSQKHILTQETSKETSQGEIADVTSSKSEEKTDEESQAEKLDGALMVDFLFDLGTSCLEKKDLKWTSLTANILQRLRLAPSWTDSHATQCLPLKSPLSSVFTLFVVAGFPEVLCLGSAVRYSEPMGEYANLIVLKHLVELNKAFVIDVGTRKRKQVKDYELLVDQEFGQSLKPDQFSFFINSVKETVTQLKDGAKLNVEKVWVLSLILKAILANIKGTTGAEGRLQLLDGDLIPLLVYLASQATKLNRQWMLRDLEILSIRLYTHSKTSPPSISTEPISISESGHPSIQDDDDIVDNNDNKENKENDDNANQDASSECSDDSSIFYSTSTLSDSSGSGYVTPDVAPPLPGSRQSQSSVSSQVLITGLDPLEGLEDKAKSFMNVTNEALQTPLSILRAIYEKSGHSLEAVEAKIQEWFLEDDAPGVSSDIKEMAKRWEPRNTADKPSSRMDLKSVDSGVVAFSAASSLPKPSSTPSEAEPEPCIDASLKLIGGSEKSLRECYQQQQRSRSANLLKKEFNSFGKNPSKDHLHKVNYAISIMYSRHLLAALLADWPEGCVITTSTLDCTEPAQMVSVLDLLQRGEEKEVFSKVVSNIVSHCQPELLAPLTVAACTFMEEASTAPITRESVHKYKNNTEEEGHVTIRGATYLSIKFDERCSTENDCDYLTFAADPTFKHEKREFSGGHENWMDFEIPGDVVHYKFLSDSSNNDWGYKFTVIGNRLGRFDTGYIILNTVLSKQDLARHIALQELWAWLVHVACRQTGLYRLKTIQVLLQVLHTLTSAKLVTDSATIDIATAPDLALLKPLLRLLDSMNEKLVPDAASTALPSLQCALTELFMQAENLALDWGIVEDYALAMTNETKIMAAAVQGIKNVAALGLAIGIPNKASKECQRLQTATSTASISY